MSRLELSEPTSAPRCELLGWRCGILDILGGRARHLKETVRTTQRDTRSCLVNTEPNFVPVSHRRIPYTILVGVRRLTRFALTL